VNMRRASAVPGDGVTESKVKSWEQSIQMTMDE
jgi:hypothetical protein